IILVLILLILVITHIINFEIDNSMFEALSINMISNIFIVFATIFILDKLIKNHHEKRTIRDSRARYFDVIGSRHELFVSKLETLIIHYVTKEPTEVEFETKNKKK